MSTQKQITEELNEIAEKLNLATSKEDAIQKGLTKYLQLEFSGHYGGYRVVNVNVKGGGHSGAFGESACIDRISGKLMLLKLKYILLGINLQKH
jgi:hypothetical protein